MRKFVASSPEAKVLGRGLLPYESNILAADLKPFLKRHGLDPIDPEAWYPQQVTLDTLKEIHQASLSKLSMVALGMRIMEDVGFPPHMPFLEAIGAIPEIYHQTHKDLGEGDTVHVIVKNGCEIEVINATPYPDGMVYGHLHIISQRLAPEGSDPVVEYVDESTVNSDEATAIRITW